MASRHIVASLILAATAACQKPARTSASQRLSDRHPAFAALVETQTGLKFADDPYEKLYVSFSMIDLEPSLRKSVSWDSVSINIECRDESGQLRTSASISESVDFESQSFHWRPAYDTCRFDVDVGNLGECSGPYVIGGISGEKISESESLVSPVSLCVSRKF